MNMSFSERMIEILDQGIAASKEFAVKTGEKAKDLGERGILILEIKQLEGRVREIVNRLGKESYLAFFERKEESVHRDKPEIAEILTELEKIQNVLEQKEAELQNKKNKADGIA